MKMRILIFIILLANLLGCGRASESALNDILEKDPSFSKHFKAKKRLSAEISALRNEFKKSHDSDMREINSLKEKLRAGKNELDGKIRLIKQELEPAIAMLKAELHEKTSENNLKKQNLKDALSKLKNIGKLLGKKSELSLSGDEISIWNKRAKKLEKEIVSLKKDIDVLRSKTRILKAEIKILQE